MQGILIVKTIRWSTMGDISSRVTQNGCAIVLLFRCVLSRYHAPLKPRHTRLSPGCYRETGRDPHRVERLKRSMSPRANVLINTREVLSYVKNAGWSLREAEVTAQTFVRDRAYARRSGRSEIHRKNRGLAKRKEILQVGPGARTDQDRSPILSTRRTITSPGAIETTLSSAPGNSRSTGPPNE